MHRYTKQQRTYTYYLSELSLILMMGETGDVG